MSTTVLIQHWDPSTVASWVSSIGYQQYEKKFRDNDITGEVLTNLDGDTLKELKIKSVGHRLALCKAARQLWQQQQLANNETDELALYSSGNLLNDTQVSKVENMIKDRDAIIDEIFEQLNDLRHQVQAVQLSTAIAPPNPETSSSGILQRDSTHNIPRATVKARWRSNTAPSASNPNLADSSFNESGAIRVYGQKLHNHENESYKSIMITVHDTCSNVLPLAMKKWKIKGDWKNYALFMISHGSERCLSYDDKPLALLNSLQDQSGSPYFILRSIRTDSIQILGNKDVARSSQPFRASTYTIPLAQKELSDDGNSMLQSFEPTVQNHDDGDEVQDIAVAIYEYTADRDDELDVNIGDEFLVLDKNTTGWWIVGRGDLRGWVPSGCLLEKSQETDNDHAGGPVQGIALYDYNAVGVNELSIKKGNTLQVHKTYQHWLLADCEGQQGWVPSCYVTVAKEGEAQEDAPSQSQTNLADSIRQSVAESVALGPSNIPRSNQNINFRSFASATNSMEQLRESTTSKMSASSSLDKIQTSVSVIKPVEASPTSKETSPSKKKISPNSPALFKLDSLLESFDNEKYFAEDVTMTSSKANTYRSTTESSTRSANSQLSKAKLGDLLNQIGTEWPEESQ